MSAEPVKDLVVTGTHQPLGGGSAFDDRHEAVEVRATASKFDGLRDASLAKFGLEVWDLTPQQRAELYIEHGVMPVPSPPVRLGDTLYQAQYRAAPEGTVVRDGAPTYFMKMRDGSWVCSEDRGHDHDLSLGRVVAYVPEVTP